VSSLVCSLANVVEWAYAEEYLGDSARGSEVYSQGLRAAGSN